MNAYSAHSYIFIHINVHLCVCVCVREDLLLVEDVVERGDLTVFVRSKHLAE